MRKLLPNGIVRIYMGVRQNRPQMREKVFGKNSVVANGEYGRLSVPPEVLDDEEFEVDVGTEVVFVGRQDDDGKRLVLEIKEE